MIWETKKRGNTGVLTRRPAKLPNRWPKKTGKTIRQRPLSICQCCRWESRDTELLVAIESKLLTIGQAPNSFVMCWQTGQTGWNHNPPEVKVGKPWPWGGRKLSEEYTRVPLRADALRGPFFFEDNAMVSVSLLWVYWRDITKSLINDCWWNTGQPFKGKTVRETRA